MMIVAVELSIMAVHPASWAISTDETFATVVKVGAFVSFLAVPSIWQSNLPTVQTMFLPLSTIEIALVAGL